MPPHIDLSGKTSGSKLLLYGLRRGGHTHFFTRLYKVCNNPNSPFFPSVRLWMLIRSFTKKTLFLFCFNLCNNLNPHSRFLGIAMKFN
ncbi:hypothetical protein Hanom_Chr04g00326521 [Helianthus anomalus]